MIITGRRKLINNLIKGYMNVTTLFTAFLKAFKFALYQRKEDMKFDTT